MLAGGGASLGDEYNHKERWVIDYPPWLEWWFIGDEILPT